MNKGELVKQVSERAQLDAAAARRAVEAVIDEISERLAAGEDVSLTGFGKFSVVARSEREGVNPREPGSRITIPARRVPRFTPGSQLRQKVAAGRDGQAALDPVSLVAGQSLPLAGVPPHEPAPQQPAVALMASQSEAAPLVTPAADDKPKSGRGRSRKASEASAGKGSGASGSKSSGKSTGKNSGTSAGKTTRRSSGSSRRTKEG